jgi:carboxyl-terminal processing protease
VGKERMKSASWQYRKSILVVAALAGALLLSVYRDGRPGFASRARPQLQEQTHEGIRDDFRAVRLRILSRVIMLVHERYIEPERVDQRAMLLGALDYVQRSVAEVLVSHQEGAEELTVHVDTAEQSFSLADLDRPWALTFRFREIFRFIHSHLRDENVELQDIEYAAANGLLQTLDPHSVLLVPDLYEEMRLGTRGEFGGLGIVISIKDGELTIVSPIDGTPAARAGLRSLDRIVMIGNETTINMTLEEAVDRLRGPPGTKVAIRIMRRGWTEPKLYEITRAIIRIESVESQLLEGRVGYIKIRNFQGNTHDELLEHLAQLRRQGMNALILDLRDDPGGLLDQAIQVADTFLSQGVIVTTAGNTPAEREARRASAAGTEPEYPIVVLVNSGSASASEIVAGALKGNNRALVMGERTFGKGSVQVLYDFDDGSALKLTIAHYLTPGDVSIQSVGIVPDLEVVPLFVSARRVDLIPDETSLRESSLEAHLDSRSQSPEERPAYRLTYYRGPSEPGGEEEDDGDGDQDGDQDQNDQDQDQDQAQNDQNDRAQDQAQNDQNDQAQNDQDEENDEAEPERDDPEARLRRLMKDFEIRFARDLVQNGRRGDRASLLTRAAELVEEQQQVENNRIVEALRRLDVDWAAGPDQGETSLAVNLTAEGEGEGGRAGVVSSGQRLNLTLAVTNNGTRPVYRLHGRTKSDNPYFDDRELPLGRIDPGQTESWSVHLRVPRDSRTRTDPIEVQFSELHDHGPENSAVDVTVHGLSRPTFSYAYQVMDTAEGDGNGRVSRGERIRLLVTVTNQGPGKSYNSQVNIKNESGEGILIHDGRFELGEMEPGQSQCHPFEFEVLRTFEDNEVELVLAISDIDLREEVSEALSFPVIEETRRPETRSGWLRADERHEVYEWPDAQAHHVGWLKAGGAYEIQAQRDQYVRLQLEKQRTGWVNHEGVRLRDGAPGSAMTGADSFELRMDNTPPDISFASEPPLRVDAPSINVRGTVTDADRVLDLYVFVGRRKVFYLSNREGQDERNLTFDAELPLEPASNMILVVARENNDVVARRIFVVRRDGGTEPATTTAAAGGNE